MVLYMNMKQLGKRRNMVNQVPFTYAVAPGNLRELITETVKLCVSRYIEAMNWGEAVLSNAQIDDMAQIGHTLHKRFTIKLALTSCKNYLDFVWFCLLYKSVKKLVK